MTSISFFRILALVAILFVNDSCKKETPVTGSGNIIGTNNPPPPINTAPKANAGSDIELNVPTNYGDLFGTAYDKEDNIVMYRWKKISGPASFFIVDPNSQTTQLSRLQIGVYQFELTVTDREGLYGKDTIIVVVKGLPANTLEIILENQTWIFPWYNTIEIKDIYNLISTGSSFRIFIKRNFNPGWIEVNPLTIAASAGSYEYFIETRPDGAGIYNLGTLYIFYYGTDVSDTPKVKIVF